ncbi:MAG: DUF192 domain-containing protein [Rhodospirillales bacterium]
MASRFFRTLRHINAIALVAALVLGVTAVAVPASQADNVSLTIETDTSAYPFTVEVMRKPEDRARGLMHRKKLAESHGMLFDFGRNVIARMWMKNTFIPLDILFIRTDGTIANIARDTVPHSTEVLRSKGKVRYVLEINAGLSMRFGITAGDKVRLPAAIPE